MAIALKTGKDGECDNGLNRLAPQLVADPSTIVVFVGIATVGTSKTKYVRGLEAMAGTPDRVEIELAAVAIEALDGWAAEDARRLLEEAREKRTKQPRLIKDEADDEAEPATGLRRIDLTAEQQKTILANWDTMTAEDPDLADAEISFGEAEVEAEIEAQAEAEPEPAVEAELEAEPEPATAA
jgi:hypothetical protein